MKNKLKLREFYYKPSLDENGVNYMKSLTTEKRMLMILGILCDVGKNTYMENEKKFGDHEVHELIESIKREKDEEKKKILIESMDKRVDDAINFIANFYDTPKGKEYKASKMNFLNTNFSEDISTIRKMIKESDNKLGKYQIELEDKYLK